MRLTVRGDRFRPASITGQASLGGAAVAVQDEFSDSGVGA
jgi:hypothetical protein